MVRDIGGTSSNDVWIVGSYETATPGNMKNLVMHWNGTSWQSFAGTDLSTTLNDLWGVTAISSNDVWAAGSYNTPSNTKAQLMHWNGSSWTHTVLPTNPGGSYLDGIDAISANDIWAVGGQAGSPTRPSYTLHYNGSSWTEVSAPSIGIFRNAFYDVDGINANDVWAVGHYGNTIGDFHAMAQHWNGSAWTNFTLPANVSGPIGELYNVSMIAANDVWALGSTITGDMLMIHYNGTSWSQVSTTGATGGAFAPRPGELFAVGSRISQWNGSNWAIIDSINQVEYPTLVASVTFSNGDIWAGGISGLESMNTFVYRTSAAPLSVKLGLYDVSKTGTTATIQWNTLEEINTDRFILERSHDLLTFIPIQETPAFGRAHHYKLSDTSPLPGSNYYRLKVIDIDGLITLYPIRKLTFENNNLDALTFYPNPVQGQEVQLHLPGVGERTLFLTDAMGQKIMRWVIQIEENDKRIFLPDGLAPGLYVFTLADGKEIWSEKMMVD
jgi:hypothetical protein